MKQTLIGIACLIALVVGYLNLPLEWRRQKDIELGNTLIGRIEQHRQQQGRLPESNENTFRQLGFRHSKETGWQPDYRTTVDGHFVIVYESGYRKPYLMWDSRERRWHLDIVD